MADLKIDTAAAAAAAERLQQINREIDEGFSPVLNAIRRMEDNWSGEAAVHSAEAFEKLRQNFVSRRQSVLESYAEVLHRQIAQGYEAVEATNVATAKNLKESLL